LTSTQIVFGSSLVAVLLGLAFYYARQQLQVLRKTAGSAEAHSSEGVYLRRQAWRRLACSALMVLLAVLLAGALIFLEEPAQRLAEQGAEAAEAPEHRAFVNFLAYYWIVFLLLLLALVVLAGIDFWAVRRFGLRELKRIQDDRRAMIARQSALLRQKREQEGR
jgi:H+/gluconate symporter-like permease